MQITYRIEQYDIDDFKIIITKPEYLSGIRTKIHTPHLLLSELQQNIAKNLTQNIHSFCVKHKQYADVLRKESFEFTPDERDKHGANNNPCWFYTGKFIDDTKYKISDKERNTIYYENYYRYAQQAKPIFYLKMNRQGKDKPIVFQKSFKNRDIDANELIKYFGIKKSEIKYWNRIQRDWCSTKGNNKNSVYFPRYIKKGGRNIYPIREINKYVGNLFEHNRPKYDFIIQNFQKKHLTAF